MKPPKPPTVDAYIAAAAPEAQTTLSVLRALIRATIPEAEESIWYNVPFYRLHGAELAGFSVLKAHVSFGFGPSVLEPVDRATLEARGYVLGKGTMRIRFDQDVPVAEIRKILRAKAAQA